MILKGLIQMKEITKALLGRLGLLIYMSKLKKRVRCYTAAEHRLVKEAFANHFREDVKPVLIWTSHKSASSLISRLFKSLRSKNLVRYYDYETQPTRYGNVSNAGDLNEILETQQRILFSEPGAIYGPLRHPYNITDASNYRHIIFLRDPRDVAVSAYYWFRDHSAIPDHKFWADAALERRRHLHSIGVGEYSLDAANDWLIPLYTHLRDLKESGAEVFFISYDEFRADTRRVLADAVDFSLGSLTPKQLMAVEDFCSELVVKPRSAHRRSGASGQFYAEMSVEEVERLSEALGEVLLYWGFDN